MEFLTFLLLPHSFYLCLFMLMYITFLCLLCFPSSPLLQQSVTASRVRLLFMLLKTPLLDCSQQVPNKYFQIHEQNLFSVLLPQQKGKENRKRVTDLSRNLIFGVLLCYFGHFLVYALKLFSHDPFDDHLSIPAGLSWCKKYCIFFFIKCVAVMALMQPPLIMDLQCLQSISVSSAFF